MMKNSLLRLYSIVLTLAMLFCLSISAYAENDDSVMDCDVVVVGGGAAGLCSAIRAAQGGANVILIEKAGILGGNTNFAEGVFGSGSSLQKELGIEVDNAALLQKEMDFQNYKINRTLFENMISQSGENVEWLLSIGVKFLTVTNTGDGAKTWHLYDGEYGHGGNLVHALKNVADDLGITILLDTAGKELIMKDGKVAGIMAEKKDGSSLQINAKAAVLATGGFGANQEMVAERANLDPNKLYYRGASTVTGDGIRMSEAVGGTTTGTTTLALIGVTVPGTPITSHMNAAAGFEQSNVWVNQDGNRFYNEDACVHMTCSTNALVTEERVFSIMDQKTIDRCMTEGCTTGFAAYVFGGTVMDKLQEEIDTATVDNAENVFKADTIEELAEKMGVNPENLKVTIDKYNEACANGVDDYLGKSAEHLVPVDTAPYYGYRLKANLLNSMGGIKVNANAEVMDVNYEPIPGLYAAGMECDGFSGETYGIILPGSDQGIAVYTGSQAGIHAAEYVAQ